MPAAKPRAKSKGRSKASKAASTSKQKSKQKAEKEDMMLYVQQPPVSPDEEEEWVESVTKKFSKAALLEKLEAIGVGKTKGTKKKLAGLILKALKEKLDESMDGEIEISDEEEPEDTNLDSEEDDVNVLSEKDIDSDDDEFDPTEDPAYRSELDADLLDGEDPEVYIEDESGSHQYDISDDDDDEDGEDLYEGENEWVMTMRKRLGLTSSGGSSLFICGWKDPTFLFVFSTLMSVVFVQGDAATQTLKMTPLADIPQTLAAHVLDPAWAAGAIFLYAAYKLSGGEAATKGRFSYAERCAAGWYLWNGCIIHLMMDGMAGGPHGGWGLKLMHENYRIVDRRFNEADTTALESDVAVGTVVTQTELIFHSTLCLFAYVGLASRKGWADGVGLVALSFQLFGAFVFVIPEFMTGCENMVPHGVKNCAPGFSWFENFYFWFGVGVNIVWVIIPMVMIWNIWRSYA